MAKFLLVCSLCALLCAVVVAEDELEIDDGDTTEMGGGAKGDDEEARLAAQFEADQAFLTSLP